MTRRTQREIVAAVLLVLGLAAVLVPLVMALTLGPLREAEQLNYPGRVTFTQNSGIYTKVAWDAADLDNPGPCPLAAHLAGVDFDAAALGSPDQLRRLGWTEQVHTNSDGEITGTTTMRSPGQVVECKYWAGRLINVTADGAKAKPVGELAVSLGGRRVALPNSAEGITAALGPPLPKN